jgi:hypothetical protein
MSKRRKHIKDILLADDKKVLEVEVSYAEGGMSYFSGESSLRGYYLSVRPVEKSEGFTTFALFAGLKLLLEEASRFSAKRLEKIEPTQEQVDNVVAQVCRKEGLVLA